MKKIGLLALFLLVSGCAQAPTNEQMAAAYYGRDMEQNECIKISEDLVSSQLKDPMSAVFKHEGCRKGFWKSAPVLGQSIAYGWLNSGYVNGKNAFGGYVGFRQYQVLVRDGQPIRYCIADGNGMCIPTNL